MAFGMCTIIWLTMMFSRINDNGRMTYKYRSQWKTGDRKREQPMTLWVILFDMVAVAMAWCYSLISTLSNIYHNFPTYICDPFFTLPRRLSAKKILLNFSFCDMILSHRCSIFYYCVLVSSAHSRILIDVFMYFKVWNVSFWLSLHRRKRQIPSPLLMNWAQFCCVLTR